MDILITVNIILKVIAIIVLIAIFVKVNHLISLTIKNHNTVMTQLKDFQDQAGRIDAATQSIKDHLAGDGMSATDSDAALKVVRDAVDNLVAAVTPPAQTQG